ncbi:MAG: hypothetical protein SGPRY_003499 [Prymnesium sp.]
MSGHPSLPIPPPPLAPSECEGASFASLCGEDASLVVAIIFALPTSFIVLFLYFFCFSKNRDKYTYNIRRAEEQEKPWVGPDAPQSTKDWIRLVLSIPDEEYEAAAGLDALTFLIAHRIVIKSLRWALVVGVVLGGVYVMAAEVYDGDKTYPEGGLARLSLSNVIYGGWESWVANWFATVGMYVISWKTLSYVEEGWLDIVQRRQRKLISGSITDRTVLVRNPPSCERLSEGQILKVWEELFPGDVLGVQLIRDTGSMTKLYQTRKKLIVKIEHLDECIQEKGEAHKGRCGGKTLGNKREKLAAKLEEVNIQLVAEHAKYSADETGVNYFVLFKTYRSCNTAKSFSALGAVGLHEVISAPMPADVNYPALEPAVVHKFAQQRIIAPWLFTALLVFYLVPIAGISTLLNADNLTFLDPVFDALGSSIRAVFMAFLPQLATIIFMILLPSICMFFAKQMGPPLISVCQADAFHRLMTFYFVWFFIGVTLSSAALALLDKVDEITKDALGTLQDTGQALAAAALYFMTFIGLQSLFALPLKELSLAVPIILELIFRKIGLQRKDEIKPMPAKYDVMWVKFMFVSCLGLCYSVLSPVTTLFAMFYVCTGYLYYARNLLFSYTHESESNGLFYPRFSSWMMVFLFMSQLLLFLTELVNTMPASAIPLVPIMLITWAKHKSFKRKYVPLLFKLPLLASVEADIREGLTPELKSAIVDATSDAEAARSPARSPAQSPARSPAKSPGGQRTEPGQDAAQPLDADDTRGLPALTLMPERELRKAFEKYAQAEFDLPPDLKDMPLREVEDNGILGNMLRSNSKPNKVSPQSA